VFRHGVDDGSILDLVDALDTKQHALDGHHVFIITEDFDPRDVFTFHFGILSIADHIDFSPAIVKTQFVYYYYSMLFKIGDIVCVKTLRPYLHGRRINDLAVVTEGNYPILCGGIGATLPAIDMRIEWGDDVSQRVYSDDFRLALDSEESKRTTNEQVASLPDSRDYLAALEEARGENNG
jgi:hypothetical protein